MSLVRSVKDLHQPYQALLSASMGNGTITLLESITKVPDRQVAKTGKSSIFFFLSSSLSHTSMITIEAIKTIQTLKNGTNHWVYCTHHLLLLVGSSSTPMYLHACHYTPFSKWKLHHWLESNSATSDPLLEGSRVQKGIFP